MSPLRARSFLDEIKPVFCFAIPRCLAGEAIDEASQPALDQQIIGIECQNLWRLSEEEVTDIVAFLGALTGEVPEVTYPVLPAETASTPRPTGEVIVE